MSEITKLARQRDKLRRKQVRDRERVHDLREDLKRRGRWVRHLGQRIRHLRRQDVHQSANGRRFLIAQEGIVLHTYEDSEGYCTACVGHLIALSPCYGQRSFTRAQCEAMLADDVKLYEKAVKNAIHVPLRQHQIDALICLAFNIGSNGFTTSTLVQRINAKAGSKAIEEAWLMWQIPAALLPRRRREVDLYLNAQY